MRRGITPCMVGIIPYAGLDIAAFELMRERLHELYDDRPPPQYLLLAGMLSSTGAQLVAYPLGLIRTRLQVMCCSFFQTFRPYMRYCGSYRLESGLCCDVCS